MKPLYIGQFEIISELGRGSSGRVYLARDMRSSEIAALKVLTRRGEIGALDRNLVAHPYICRVYEINEVNGLPFVFMEYLQGQSLAQLFTSRSTLGLHDALRYGVQVADALAHIHECGHIHDDLTPNHIILTKSGVKLIGIASMEPRTGDIRLKGFQAYQSPEELLGQTIGPASDVFRFGVILYEMVARQRPFAGHGFGYVQALVGSEPLPLTLGEGGAIPASSTVLYTSVWQRKPVPGHRQQV